MTEEQLQALLDKFCAAALRMTELKIREIILFGSYARGDADEESDVDIMILTDIPAEEIPEYRYQLARLSSELSLEFGPVVSALLKNYDSFTHWQGVLPFYQNVRREGVCLHAA